MARADLSNPGRWILSLQMAVFFLLGGLQLWAFPKEACPYMADSRAVVHDCAAGWALNARHPEWQAVDAQAAEPGRFA